LSVGYVADPLPALLFSKSHGTPLQVEAGSVSPPVPLL
jgi:hypothetical protein